MFDFIIANSENPANIRYFHNGKYIWHNLYRTA